MNKVKDLILIEKYIKIHNISNLFSPYIKENIELLFFDKRELIFEGGGDYSFNVFC